MLFAFALPWGFFLFTVFFLLFGCVYPVEQVCCFEVNCPNRCLNVLSIHAESDQVAAKLLVDAASYDTPMTRGM